MKVINIDECGLTFDNGTVVVDQHNQDCCENVYADWNQLKDTDILSHEFPEIINLEGIKDAGIRINGYFVPCYNSQNGFYSNNLSLVVTYPDGNNITADITDFVKDCLN